MFSNTVEPNAYTGKTEKRNVFSAFHRIACVCGSLLVLCWLLMCCIAFIGAMQDARKYGGLGFDYSFWHYLNKNHFLEALGIFVCVTAELMLYIAQCRRLEEYVIPSRGSILYFAAMLTLHTAIWLHVNLIVQGYPAESSVSAMEVYYRTYANISLLPAIVYFAVYLLRAWKLKSETDL